jgi:glycosyltransferase involved in cell wall biosynthesis
MLEHVFQRAAEFDIVHFHVDYLHFPLSRREQLTHVTTLHGRLDIPDLVPLYHEFRDMPVVSISNCQREPLPWANWQATVYHGVPADMYQFRGEPGSYLAFLGRISPEKRVDRAIEIAKRVQIPLKIAAKVDRVVEALEDAVEAVRRVPELSRKRCREIFDQRFTAARMARDYVQLYERLIKSKRPKILEACA